MADYENPMTTILYVQSIWTFDYLLKFNIFLIRVDFCNTL